VKDKETGGDTTILDQPILFDFNRGLGFTVEGINPLNGVVDTLSKLEPNKSFEEEVRERNDKQNQIDNNFVTEDETDELPF